MRCCLSTLTLTLIVSAFAGCRSQSPTMTNPFLAPDRVPPPATRTLVPGTAQPYYGTAPVPNTPVIGQPPAGFSTGAPVQTTPSTFAPQPAGTVPPGGWNSTPQAFPPQGSNGYLPSGQSSVVQIQPDQQNLRFEPSTQTYQPPIFSSASNSSPTLPPDPSILPTPQQGPIQFGVQPASYQTPVTPQPVLQQPAPVSDPREVRIRAISSDNITSDGQSRFRDGFRPQGTTQVRKPTLPERFAPQPTSQPAADHRFGFAPQYDWLRGQLHYAPGTGQWSLQYTPSGVVNEPFGGELPIANPEVLGPLNAGAFVQLRGRVDSSRTSNPASSSVYRVSVVQRQRI